MELVASALVYGTGAPPPGQTVLRIHSPTPTPTTTASPSHADGLRSPIPTERPSSPSVCSAHHPHPVRYSVYISGYTQRQRQPRNPSSAQVSSGTHHRNLPHLRHLLPPPRSSSIAACKPACRFSSRNNSYSGYFARMLVSSMVAVGDAGVGTLPHPANPARAANFWTRSGAVRGGFCLD